MLNKIQKLWNQFQTKSLSMEDVVDSVVGQVSFGKKLSNLILHKLYAEQKFRVQMWSKITGKTEYDKEIFKNYLKTLIFPSKETKLSAVMIDYSLVSLFEDDPEVVLQAYEVNSRSIQFMSKHSPDFQRHIVKQMRREYSMSLYIDTLKVTEQDVANDIVDINHAYLRMIPENLQTEELVWKVIEARPELIDYVKNPSEKIKLYICENCPSKIKELTNTTHEMEMLAVKRIPRLFEDIKNPTDETCMYILENVEQFLKDAKKDHMPFRYSEWRNLVRKATDRATTDNTKVYGEMKYASLFN